MRNSELGIRNFNRSNEPRVLVNPALVEARHASPLRNLRPPARHLTAILFVFTFTLLHFYTFSQPAFADNQTPTVVIDKSLPKVTVIPNPARGKKLNFRVMASGPCKVRIRVNNRFFDPIATIEKEGGAYFDIQWNLKTVSEGIYYYQAQIEDKATGQVAKLPLQKFVVLK